MAVTDVETRIGQPYLCDVSHQHLQLSFFQRDLHFIFAALYASHHQHIIAKQPSTATVMTMKYTTAAATALLVGQAAAWSSMSMKTGVYMVVVKFFFSSVRL